MLNQVGLAAAVLLVPGGLLLGAALVARRYRQRAVAEVGVEIAPDSAALSGEEAASS